MDPYEKKRKEIREVLSGKKKDRVNEVPPLHPFYMAATSSLAREFNIDIPVSKPLPFRGTHLLMERIF